ncbi:MAG: BNR-4 repeat-containing protein [Planctomycetes bacterium]|nr:BNR-4 repeat-containing protein [Planctomycetota bacterium]
MLIRNLIPDVTSTLRCMLPPLCGLSAIWGLEQAPTCPEPIMLTEDGGWCWFEGPRAVFDGERLIVGSVPSGWNDPQRRGDIEVIVHEAQSRQTHIVELHDRFELDDHDSPALLVRPDNRILAVYAKHGKEWRFNYRISRQDSPLEWDAEIKYTPNLRTRLTYSNLYCLSEESNRVYNFFRGLYFSYKPSFAYSDDLGSTWTCGNIVIDVPQVREVEVPYVRYASNDRDVIHLVYTEGHPRASDNSIYHIFYRKGTLHRSDGTEICPLTTGLARPDQGTRIFQGSPDAVAWTVDVIDGDGRPAVVYSVQMGSAGLPAGQGGDDIRYRYARWDGTTWRDAALAFAGTRLFAGEDDYSGLAAIDPLDPSVVYISTNADPESGSPLMSEADGKRHHELFRGRSSDGGASWRWEPVTKNSTKDNLRPILASARTARRNALVWLRGDMPNFTDYRLEVVALFLEQE